MHLDDGLLFEQYVAYINSNKRVKSIGLGRNKLTSLVFINFGLILYGRKVDRTRRELTLLTNLNDFEGWLVDPTNFDYDKFDAKWLIDLHGLGILQELTEIAPIASAIDKELLATFNPLLAEIKYKYFRHNPAE